MHHQGRKSTLQIGSQSHLSNRRGLTIWRAWKDKERESRFCENIIWRGLATQHPLWQLQDRLPLRRSFPDEQKKKSQVPRRWEYAHKQATRFPRVGQAIASRSKTGRRGGGREVISAVHPTCHFIQRLHFDTPEGSSLSHPSHSLPPVPLSLPPQHPTTAALVAPRQRRVSAGSLQTPQSLSKVTEMSLTEAPSSFLPFSFPIPSSVVTLPLP